jgi:hypothetical protein
MIEVRKIYRVSWYVNDKRNERLFASRSWAEQFVLKLFEASNIIGYPVDPMVGEVEVVGE